MKESAFPECPQFPHVIFTHIFLALFLAIPPRVLVSPPALPRLYAYRLSTFAAPQQAFGLASHGSGSVCRCVGKNGIQLATSCQDSSIQILSIGKNIP